MTHELRTAYEMSRREANLGPSPQIRHALEDGKVAVVCREAVYCHRTDAILGDRTILVDSFTPENRHYAELLARKLNEESMGEGDYSVLPALPPPPPDPTEGMASRWDDWAD